jgi:hypothetical protein
LDPGCAPATSSPCQGPNCIPQPSTLVPSTPPPAQVPDGTGPEAAECGLTDLTGCMVVAASALLAAIVAAGMNPLLDLLGKTLLTTPEPDQLPGLGAVWVGSWHILLTAYVILVLMAGLIIMGYQTLQARYTVKELAPRLVVGFLTGTLSLFLMTKGVQVANALSAAVLGEGVDQAQMTRSNRGLGGFDRWMVDRFPLGDESVEVVGVQTAGNPRQCVGRGVQRQLR